MAVVGPGLAARDQREDVTILVETTAHAMAAALAALAPSDARLAVCGATDWTGVGAAPAGLIALDETAPSAILARAVAAVWRTATAEDEAAARAATFAALGLRRPSPPEPPRRGPRILYVGAPDPFYLAFERAAQNADGDVRAALTSFAAFDHLHDEPFDAVALNGGADPASTLSLCGALRRNADLHTLPTLFIAQADDGAGADAAERGAAVTCDVRADAGAALAWLAQAVAVERRRRTAETDLAAMRAAAAEPRTGLFNPAFIEAHIETLAQRAHAAGRPLSVACLRISPAPGASAPHPAAWARGFSEAAALAGRVVRTADSAAVWDDNTLAFAFPGLDLAEAESAIGRIVAIGECTAFAADGGAGPLDFHRATMMLAPGESGAGVLARALGGLNAWAARA